jgi:hypothetical protein
MKTNLYLENFTQLIVTGRYYNSNRRFKRTYEATRAGYSTAMMINLWNGSVYGVTKEGKRKLIKRVIN